MIYGVRLFRQKRKMALCADTGVSTSKIVGAHKVSERRWVTQSITGMHGLDFRLGAFGFFIGFMVIGRRDDDVPTMPNPQTIGSIAKVTP